MCHSWHDTYGVKSGSGHLRSAVLSLDSVGVWAQSSVSFPRGGTQQIPRYEHYRSGQHSPQLHSPPTRHSAPCFPLLSSALTADAVSDADWAKCYQANVMGHLWLMQDVEEELKKNEGSFVISASIAGLKLTGSSMVSEFASEASNIPA